MPFVITLKEPIRDLNYNEVKVIVADFVMADAATPDGLIVYRANGKLNVLPIDNILGTFYQQEKSQ